MKCARSDSPRYIGTTECHPRGHFCRRDRKYHQNAVKTIWVSGSVRRRFLFFFFFVCLFGWGFFAFVLWFVMFASTLLLWLQHFFLAFVFFCIYVSFFVATFLCLKRLTIWSISYLQRFWFAVVLCIFFNSHLFVPFIFFCLHLSFGPLHTAAVNGWSAER